MVLLEASMLNIPTLLLSLMAQFPATPGLPQPEQPPVIRMTVTPGQHLAAEGQVNFALCTLEIPRDFHVYWTNPGVSGTQTEIEVAAPEGCTIGPVQFPRPGIFHEPEGVTYGYETRVTFIIPITLPRGVEPVEVEIKARWLACRKACYMGQSSSSITLKPIEHVEVVPVPALVRAKKAMPRPMAERPGTRARLEGGQLVITGPVDTAGSPSFIPGHVPGVELGKVDVQGDETGFRLVVPYEVHPENGLGNELQVHGLLVFGTDRLDPAFEIRMPVSSTTGSGTAPGTREEED
jgi:DsbC/DsbD-like thiol-disulfide interchange protein